MGPLKCTYLSTLDLFVVPSSSVDGSDLLLVVAILQLILVLYVYNGLPEEHFILSRLLDFRAFYLCTQSPEEGAVNRICFIPSLCERLSIRNRIMPVPGQ